MMEKNEPLEWSTNGPYGEVVLKKSTMDVHVQEDHYTTDALFRKKIVGSIREVVTDPRFIINDTTSEFNNDSYARKIYLDCALCDDKVKVMIVYVEDKRTPKEVVTYWGSSKGYNKFVREEDVIYDRKGADEYE